MKITGLISLPYPVSSSIHKAIDMSFGLIMED